MGLETGTQLGPYRITGVLGKGGMGEVYRAHDPRLQRDVAIKVSAQRFTETFEREARAIAALNHPNICQIYDVGPNYLVMELVEGEAPKGPMELDEALRVAGQIADALQEAHEKHITHRDLKPGNIKITPDGKVKVLDFGLAKIGGIASTVVDGDSPTISMAATQAGVVLGTAAYMAPEQARGKSVDTRADIWAFGVVLYELLTGKRLFEGEDLTETLASVVKENPRLDAVPVRVRRLLESCLQKDPKKRLQSIGDMRLLLDAPADTDAAQPRSRWLWPAIAGVAVLSLVALGAIHFREAPANDTVLHLSVPMPEGATSLGFVVLSPDGHRVVAGFGRDGWTGLWVRALDGAEWTRLDSTRIGRTPFWSPDSRFIAFFADGKLKTVPAAGGPARELCDETGIGRGGAWNRAGVILFASSTGPLRRVQSDGGACTTVTKNDAQVAVALPEFLPDGKHYLYVGAISGSIATRGVYVASLDDPIREGLAGKKVLDDFSSVVYVEPEDSSGFGSLLFLRGSILMAQPFDSIKLESRGDPFPVAPQASMSFTGPQVAASAAADGTLIYLANRSREYQLTWIDRSGKQRTKVGPPAEQNSISLSHDGTLATVLRRDEGLRLFDLARGSQLRFSTDDAPSPGVWSADNNEITFGSTINGVRGIYRKPANGSGKETLLLSSTDNRRRPSDWSDKYLIYTEVDSKSRGDIWYLPDPGNPNSKPVKFLGTDAIESQGQLSPNGHWLAYFSGESGSGVFIRQFPSGEGFAKVSLEYGYDPRWNKNGSEIYYLHSGEHGIEVMAVPMTADGRGGLHPGTPIALFEFPATNTVQDSNSWLYSPHPDGQRFLVAVREETLTPSFNLITNWRKAAAATTAR